MSRLLSLALKACPLMIAAAALFMSGCSTNPATGRTELVTVTSKKERRIGAKLHKEIMEEEKQYADPDWDAYVNLVGKHIAANSDLPEEEFKFIVLQSEDINAFALPNAHIYITTGMLAHLHKESHLAAILAHEIAHVTARHAARKITRNTLLESVAGPISFAAWSVPVLGLVAGDAITKKLAKTQTVLVRGYGRELELQADTLGAKYLARAGYDPEDMIEVLAILKDQERYRADLIEKEIAQEFELGVSYHASNTSTHPTADQRLAEVIRVAEDYLQSGKAREDRENFMLMVDGLEVDTQQKYIMTPDWTELHDIDINIKGHIPYTFKNYDPLDSSDDNLLQIPVGDINADYVLLDSEHTVRRVAAEGGGHDWESRYINTPLVFTVNQRPTDRTPKEYLLEYLNAQAVDIDYLDHQAVQSRFGDGYFIQANITQPYQNAALDSDQQKTAQATHMAGAVFIGDHAILVNTMSGVFNFGKLMHKRIFISLLENLRPEQADDQFDHEISRETYRIAVKIIEPGDTFASLTEEILIDNAEARLRLVNGYYPSGEPEVGQAIKVFSAKGD